MKYIIDEEELKGIYESAYYDCEEHNWRMTLEIKAFLKFKQPVELVAEGEVDIQMAMNNPYGDDYLVGETLIDLEKYRGQNIKIYIQKVKEI